jgi:hypothetical protein
MRALAGSVAVTILALLVAVPLGGAASTPALELQSMKVSASTHVAGAHHVRLTIALTYEMQCGYPGAGPIVVTFPSAAKLPGQFAAGSVKLSGKAVAATIKGRKVSVTVPPHDGVLCGTIGPGRATITFTHAAKVGNPAQAGSYRFTAVHTKRTFSAKLVIKPAA